MGYTPQKSIDAQLQAKTDALQAEFDAKAAVLKSDFEAKNSALESELAEKDAKIAEIESKANANKDDLTGVKPTVSRIDQDVSVLRTRLDELYLSLQLQIVGLQKQIDALNGTSVKIAN